MKRLVFLVQDWFNGRTEQRRRIYIKFSGLFLKNVERENFN